MVSKEKVNLFIAESEGLINKIEELIMEFEKNPKNLKAIEEMYFVFNGLSRLIGVLELENYQKFVQTVEKLLEENKEKQMKENKVNEFFDIMLQNLEILKNLVDKLEDNEIQDLSEERLEEQEQKFQAFEREYEVTFIKPLSPKEMDQELKSKNFYKIYIKIAESVKFKKVRLFFIFRALNNLGRICYSKPEPEVLEKGEFDSEFEVYFMSKSEEKEINNALEEILEINSKYIKEISREKFKKAIEPFGAKKEEEKQKIKKELEKKKAEDETLEEFLQPINSEKIRALAEDRKNIFYKIYIRIKITCKHKILRTFLIFRTLDEMGRICWSNPPPSKLEKGEFDLDFEIYFVSQEQKRKIKGKIDEILDIANKVINEINPKDFEKIINTLTKKPKVKKVPIGEKPVEKSVPQPKVSRSKGEEEKKEEIISEVPLESVSRDYNLIFTDPINNSKQKISISNFHFLKLWNSLNQDLIFSCHIDGETTSKFYLYVVLDGVLFYTFAKEYDLFKEQLNIYENGFTELHSFLKANKYGIRSSIEFQAFKDSEFYNDEVISYNKYLKMKNTT